MLSQEEPEGAERPPYVVQEAWQQSIEARGIVNNLLRRNKRRIFGINCNVYLFTRIITTISVYECQFPAERKHSNSFTGLLEKPGFDRRLPVLHQRLYLAGKAGIGKTSTVHTLMGRGMNITWACGWTGELGIEADNIIIIATCRYT